MHCSHVTLPSVCASLCISSSLSFRPIILFSAKGTHSIELRQLMAFLWRWSLFLELILTTKVQPPPGELNKNHCHLSVILQIGVKEIAIDHSRRSWKQVSCVYACRINAYRTQRIVRGEILLLTSLYTAYTFDLELIWQEVLTIILHITINFGFSISNIYPVITTFNLSKFLVYLRARLEATLLKKDVNHNGWITQPFIITIVTIIIIIFIIINMINKPI